MIKASKNTDITLEELEALGNNMPGGYFMYIAEMPEKLIYVNEELVNIYGCDSEEDLLEFTSGVFSGLVHPEDYENIEKDIFDQIDKDYERFDHVQYRAIKKSGEEIFIDDYGRLLHSEEYGDVFVVFVQDITSMKRLKEKNNKMELELERQRQLEAARDEFLFHVSHDIRTPMNAIIGYNSLALEHLDNIGLAEQYLQQVKQSSLQMLLMVDNLLDVNQLKKTNIITDPKPMNLKEQLRRLLDVFKPFASDKDISINTKASLDGDIFLIDDRLFRRIFHSILDNAIKFTKPGGSITIDVAQTKAQEPNIYNTVFAVTDTGIGMSEDFIESAFEPFEREMTSTLLKESGVGIGLSVSKGFVDALGGTIKIYSKKRVGTKVTVTLPLEKYDNETASSKNINPTDCRILLVEDIELNRMITKTVLSESGFNVECATNGKEGYEAVLNHKPNYYSMVLMDIQMPIMDGYESTRLIRTIDRDDTKSLPIIALSANVGEDAIRESLESGMNQHIAKPINSEFLINTLRSYANKEN